MTRDRQDSPTEAPRTVVPEEDLRRKSQSASGSATGGGGSGAPVERTPAENPKEHEARKQATGKAQRTPPAPESGGEGA